MPHTQEASFFWMGGRLATNLVEISHDPSCLQDGGFWAVSTTFEGAFTAARFETVIDSAFPSHNWVELNTAWTSSMSRDQYIEYVEEIQSNIAAGWVYQVNACRRLSNFVKVDSLAGLFSKILKENPSPHAAYLEIPGLNIASASPELFLSRRGCTIQSSPIKGTQQPYQEAFGSKDQAENIMIVDLMRNDFGQICKSGSVEVPRLLASEEHPGLQHLVSDIKGELIEKISWSKILESLLPPGSVSGAPKSSALNVISSNEDKRGPYCGAFGWVQGDKCELSVAIRVFWRDNGIHFGTGAGITWGSDPDKEWDETVLKAHRLIAIAGGQMA